jgi:ribose transport system permease protein
MLICVGALFLYSHGGFDISIGAVLALSSLSAAAILNNSGNLVLAIIASIAIAMACEFLNGVISALFRMPAVVISLCTMFIARALVTIFSTTKTSSYKCDYNLEIFNGIGIKIILLILIPLIGFFVFQFTKVGKYSKAIGNNIITAEQSGVNVNKYMIIGYLITALLIGITAVFVLARSGAVSKDTGNGMEMDVLIALILGGMPLTGGSLTKMSNAVLGVLSIVVLSMGLKMCGLDVLLISMVKGIMFLVIVSINFKREKTKLLPR